MPKRSMGSSHKETFKGSAEEATHSAESLDVATKERMDKLGGIVQQICANIKNPKKGIKVKLSWAEIIIREVARHQIEIQLKRLETKQARKAKQEMKFYFMVGMIANIQAVTFKHFTGRIPGPVSLLKLFKTPQFKKKLISEITKNKKQPKSKAPKRK